jgi:hypothetical protein
MGVETLIYVDNVYLEGSLIESTKDYLAQDKDGNVWYFGEDVDNYEDGVLTDHDGSWIAGEKGALPGMWINGTNKVGESYRQEYYKGEAEDMRDVVAVNKPTSTKLGSYKDCIEFYDWTPLDDQSKERKTYCAEVGALVLTTHDVKDTRTELVSIKN